MDSLNCMGLMAVVAVSSTVAFVSLHVYKNLMDDFFNKFQLEIGRETVKKPKKVRFAADVMEPSSNNKEYRKRMRSTTINNH